MPIYERGDAQIAYEVHGAGFPVLAIAPGGLRSTAAAWQGKPWNPIEALKDRFQVIAMDQRNAGASWAPIAKSDGWHSYTADQLGLIDELGFQEFHVVGMCIGGPYALRLCRAAQGRVRSAVLLQPIGLEHNRQLFLDLIEGWREDIGDRHPEAGDEVWSAFGDAMFGGDDMLFGAGRADISGCDSPLLVAMGNDPYHPSSISRQVADLAPNAELIEVWKEEAVLAETHQRICAFLERNTP